MVSKMLEKMWPAIILVPLVIVFLVMSWCKCLERRRHRAAREHLDGIVEVKGVMQ